MKIVNFVTTGAPKAVIDADRHYIPNVYGKPRDIERYVDIQHPKAKQKYENVLKGYIFYFRLWSVDNSIFKDFVLEGEGHMDQCFEFDFEAGKFQKYILN